MQAIIRRFDRAPLEDRLLRANPAQPPKGKDVRGVGSAQAQQATGTAPGNGGAPQQQRHRRKRGGKDHDRAPRSAFANELAKVL
jgi:hypothetical protein